MDKGKQYIYIIQSSKEITKCKIGKTNDLNRRLKEYNNMTGKSKENIYQYLFTCEVKNMSLVEKDIKNKYITLREEKSKEIYIPVTIGTLKTIFGNFKGIGTNQKIAKINAVKLANECWD